MAETRKVYLGDGCYVDYDGHSLILTTENGLRVTNEVVLDPDVYRALCQYVSSIGARRVSATRFGVDDPGQE